MIFFNPTPVARSESQDRHRVGRTTVPSSRRPLHTESVYPLAIAGIRCAYRRRPTGSSSWTRRLRLPGRRSTHGSSDRSASDGQTRGSLENAVAPVYLVRVHPLGRAVVVFHSRSVRRGVPQSCEFLFDAPLARSGASGADVRDPLAWIHLDDPHVP